MTVLDDLPAIYPDTDQTRLAPAVVGSSRVLPEHRYTQRELAAVALERLPTEMLREGIVERVFESVQVEERYFAVDAKRLIGLQGFQDRNDLYIEAATGLAERALLEAFA